MPTTAQHFLRFAWCPYKHRLDQSSHRIYMAKKSKPQLFSVKTFPMFVQNVSIPRPYPSYRLLLTFQYQGGWIMACTATEREYRIDRSSQPHNQVYLVPEITASAFLYSMMVMFHDRGTLSDLWTTQWIYTPYSHIVYHSILLKYSWLCWCANAQNKDS